MDSGSLSSTSSRLRPILISGGSLRRRLRPSPQGDRSPLAMKNRTSSAMLPHPTSAPNDNRAIGCTTSFKVLRRGVVRGCFRAACELRRIHKPYDAAAQEAQATRRRLRRGAVARKHPRATPLRSILDTLLNLFEFKFGKGGEDPVGLGEISGRI